MKKFLSIILCFCMAMSIVGVNTPKIKANAEEGMLITQQDEDINVIPDKYNTGCRGELMSMKDFFGDYHTEGTVLYINATIQNALGTVYENIDFTDIVNLNKLNLQSMTFRNCRFSAEGAYNVMLGDNFLSNDIEVVFENCEFLNSNSAAVQPGPKIRMINCKIHDVGSDGGKVFTEGSYENCYFYNIGMTDGSHADGIQVTGANNNFKIVNCRFDAPTYVNYVSNAALFFILEDDSYNSIVKDLYMNGGAYSMYYGRKYPDAETPVVLENNTVENITVGCSYHFGPLTDNSNSFDHSEVKEADKLFVSSVYKENGDTKLLVTNYTNTERILKVVTDNGVSSFTIPACATYDEGLAYTSLSQFPFDVECTLDEDANYVVCYDESVSEANQIRFANYTANPVYLDANLFSGTPNDPADSENMKAEGTTDIEVAMYATQVNVTVPLSVNCHINPNVEDGFTYGDIIIQNKTLAPVRVSLSDFTYTGDSKTLILPSRLPDGQEWENLSSELCRQYFAIGVSPKADTNWYKILTTEYHYAENIAGYTPLGVIGNEESAELTLTSYYGKAFKSTDNLSLRMCFVTELDNTILLTNDEVVYLSKDEMLDAVHTQKYYGNGSIAWKDWKDLRPNGLLNRFLDVSYIGDEVYTSMKLPSENTDFYMGYRTNGSIMSDNFSGCSTACGIGAFYPVYGETLPETFDLYVGNIMLFILKNGAEAQWELFNEDTVLQKITNFQLRPLPWTSDFPLADARPTGKVEFCDEYIKFNLTAEDLMQTVERPDGSVAHFYTDKLPINSDDIRACVVIYEAWSNTPGIEGKIVSTIGADFWNNASNQVFSGRSYLITNEPRHVIGHNISDETYEELLAEGKNPEQCLSYFLKNKK